MQRLCVRLGIFHRDEMGAVTVDWVVLTGAIVFLGVAAGFIVASEVPKVADATGGFIESREVGTWQY